MTDFDKWIEYLKENDKSKNTIDGYKRDVIQFMDYIQKEPEDIDKSDIERYKEYIIENNIKIRSLNRKFVAIKNFVNFLINELNATINVNIKQEKVQSKNYLDEVLTKEDFNDLVNAASVESDYRAKAIFYTLYLTGMRVSEMLQIKLTDINKDMVSIKGKGSKHRDIFIPERLKVILKEYLQHRIPRDTPFIFTSKTGHSGAINRYTVDKIIKKYAKLANVSITKAHAHNFRHLYCMSLIDKGISIDTVADLAGHSDINTTRIYTRKTKNQLLDTINDL